MIVNYWLIILRYLVTLFCNFFPLKKSMTKHDKIITPSNSSTASDQNHNQSPALENSRLKFSANSSQKQSVKVLGLAVAVSSLGAICTSAQMAQADPPNLPVANSHSSILIAQSTPQQDRAIKENSKLETHQEQTVKSSTIEVRSNTNSGTGAVTTVSVPQLPSLTIAQNVQSKTITKQIYTVRPGDTINSIARLYGIPADKIIKANKIKNPNRLSVNQQLVIPLEESPQVSLPNVVTRDISSNLSTHQENVHDPYISKLRANIDKLRNQFQNQYNTDKTQVSVNHQKSLINSEALESNYSPTPISSVSREDKNLASDNDSSSEDLLIGSAISPIDNYNKFRNSRISRIRESWQPQLPPLSSPDEYLPDNSNFFNGYMWPAQGTLTSGYGWRWGRMHKGIDIAAPIGTPIVAAATGEVISAGWNSGGYGNLVKVRHPDGSVTLYAHNNKIFVRQGQKVRQGQQIAEMGSTGYSTGPHLHFEIRTNGTTAINPIARLPKK